MGVPLYLMIDTHFYLPWVNSRLDHIYVTPFNLVNLNLES